jgi:putative oxidoreductase
MSIRADFVRRLSKDAKRWEETMNITLWVLQVLLALAFLAHGIMFLVPPPDIAAMMNAMLPRWFQVFLGVAEVLAAVGLTLPGLTRVRPGLVPAAAVGIVIVMVSATVLHLVRSEFSAAATTFVLLLMAGFVAYGRWHRYPIAPRRRDVAVS